MAIVSQMKIFSSLVSISVQSASRYRSFVDNVICLWRLLRLPFSLSYDKRVDRIYYVFTLYSLLSPPHLLLSVHYFPFELLKLSWERMWRRCRRFGSMNDDEMLCEKKSISELIRCEYVCLTRRISIASMSAWIQWSFQLFFMFHYIHDELQVSSYKVIHCVWE